MEPGRIDRFLIKLMRGNKRANRIIEEVCGEAYDMGFNAGMVEELRLMVRSTLIRLRKH